jgi:hypothetical protein
MANQTRGNSGFPNIFSAFRGEDPRKQLIDIKAARGEALASVVEVAGLLSVLPNAVIASQQRELERLKATRGDNDPRVLELQATLERAATLSAMAERGQARAERLAVAFTDSEAAFHGFVSDSDLNPLSGLTVRAGQQSSATTDADGYFRIPLGTRATRPATARELFQSLSRRTPKDTAVDPAGSEPGKELATAQVEIVRKGAIIHTDPFLLPLEDGAVYREYVLPKTPGTPRDFKNFIGRNTPAAEAPAARRGGAKAKAKRK